VIAEGDVRATGKVNASGGLVGAYSASVGAGGNASSGSEVTGGKVTITTRKKSGLIRETAKAGTPGLQKGHPGKDDASPLTEFGITHRETSRRSINEDCETTVREPRDGDDCSSDR
jgi:hypothetical protein